MTTLTCPKCGSDMRQYERNRVLVEQCTGCGGLFLDRGELERLVAAETEWHQQPATPPPSAPQPAPGYGQQPYGNAPYRGAQYGAGHRPYKKRKSFLSELFDD